MIINKSAASLTSQISLAGLTSSGTAQVYRYSAANAQQIVHTGRSDGWQQLQRDLSGQLDHTDGAAEAERAIDATGRSAAGSAVVSTWQLGGLEGCNPSKIIPFCAALRASSARSAAQESVFCRSTFHATAEHQQRHALGAGGRLFAGGAGWRARVCRRHDRHRCERAAGGRGRRICAGDPGAAEYRGGAGSGRARACKMSCGRGCMW